MSRPPRTTAGFIVETVTLVGVVIAGAWLLDKLWIWLGWKPWLVCSALALTQDFVGQALALIIVCVGVIMFALSGFRNAGYLTLIVGGIMLSQFPGVFAHYLGASCTP
ncbi:hypothetical protein [Mesorhizobium sp. M0589]|uniref:hypothetical protein n=1 Tax=Mesorhizobium sp. M0589 TaxID=2956965 RepID=UPI00333AFDA2